MSVSIRDLARVIGKAGRFYLCITALAAAVPAQMIPTGIVAGTVKDPSGGAVVNAEIALTNQLTGVTAARAKTDEHGQFLLPTIPPGSYLVTVSATGFKRWSQQVEVQVAHTATVDANLELGSLEQTVTVSAEAPLLNTVSPALATGISARFVQDLPLQSRNALATELLAPGALFSFGPQTGNNNVYGYGGQGLGSLQLSYIASNGGNTRTNAFWLDGAANNKQEQVAFVPNAEQVREVQVVSNGYDAQYGVGGTSIVVVTKSGTNDFHGNAFEMVKNDIFNANDFFANMRGAAKNRVRYNQFGGSVGGPVKRNKLFFFFNYEGMRNVSHNTQFGTVLTDLQRNGDFSRTFDQKGNLDVIYDGATTRTDPNNPAQYIRDPFPGNRLPSTRMNGAAKAIVGLLPAPNRGGEPYTNVNNFQKVVGRSLPQDLYSGRVDYALNRQNLIYGRYSQQRFSNKPGVFLFPVNFFDYGARNGVIAWTSTLGPNLILEVTSGYSRHFNPFRHKAVDLEGMGFARAFAANVPYLPVMKFGGDMSEFGAERPYFTNHDSWDINLNMRRMQGAHSLKWGLQRILYHDTDGSYHYGASFTFDRSLTQGPSPFNRAPDSGNAVASFLMGWMAGSNPDGVDSPLARALSSSMYAAYIQDDIRVTPRWTINLGVRWNAWQPARERYNRQNTGFAFNVPNPVESQARANYRQRDAAIHSILPPDQFRLQGGLLFAGADQPRWAETKWVNFDPRAAFAYRMLDRTVIRGGFGMFRNFWWYGNSRADGFSISTPVIASLDGLRPSALLNDPIPGGLLTPPGASLGLRANIGGGVTFNNQFTRPIRNTRWSFGVQQQLTETMSAEVNYVGQTAFNLHLQSGGTPPASFSNTQAQSQRREMDFVPAPYFALGAQLFSLVPNPLFGLAPANTTLGSEQVPLWRLLTAYPQFTTVRNAFDPGGRSYYHALQVTVNKRFSHGLSVLSGYTWSKTMDRYEFLNPQDAGPTKQLSIYDAPHKFNLAAIYELPFGPGRTWGWKSGLPGRLIEGWQYSLNGLFQSGMPVEIPSGVQWTGASPAIPADQRSWRQWFNKAAFTSQAQLSLRTSPWYLSSLRFHSINEWDMALVKTTTIRETWKWRLKAEVFNAPNRVMFGGYGAGPVLNPTSPVYGQVLGQGNSPRNMQLSLEVIF
jgi:hypothetical protein